MRTLVFCPSHAVWNWSYPMALVAEYLKKQGDPVFYLTCDREYSGFCMAQAANKVYFASSDSQKQKACDLCVTQRDLISHKLQLNKLSINEFITNDNRKLARVIADQTTLENYKECVVDGIYAGRLAMYEVLIQSKKHSLEFSDQELLFYRENLFNVVKTIKGFIKALDQIKPDVCFLEHTSYSSNRACQLLSSARGVSAYFANPNTFNAAHSYELLVTAKEDPSLFIKKVKEAWNNRKNIPITKSEASLVADHFISLMSARGDVYSAAKTGDGKSVREHFKINADQKVMLVASSSYDELFAADTVGGFWWDTRMRVFNSMIEWIDALNEFLIQRPDVFLIIRVHPREFIPDQYGNISAHAKVLQEKFKNLPKNVAVNWPAENISIYDLFEEADVVLSAWSSAGLEMAFCGMPVVTHCGNAMLYPKDLVYSAESKPEYFRMIEEALNDGWNFERIRKVFRWCVLMHLDVAANISDSLSYNTLKKRKFSRRLYEKIRSLFDPLYRQKLQVENRSPSLQSGAEIRKLLKSGQNLLIDVNEKAQSTSLADETEAIRCEMARVYNLVYKNDKIKSSGRLKRYWQEFLTAEQGSK